jgi:Xaa-Pro aminopeptidase
MAQNIDMNIDMNINIDPDMNLDTNLETLQPILKRGRDVWDQVNMPKREFLERVERIREAMAKESIDVLLVYGAGVNDYGNQCYVSNFVTKLTAGALVILPRKGELTLFFEGSSRELKLGQRVTWVDDTRSSLAGVFSSTGSLAGDCLNYLKEQKLIPSKIGFVGLRALMSYGEFQRLTKGTKQCEVVDAGHIIRDMRMIKSERECDQIRRASRMVSNALGTIPGMILAKMDARSLEAKIDWAVRLQGAEDVRILLAKPRNADWALRPAGETPLSAGDTIIVYLAASFERYWAEGIKTFVAENGSFAKVDDEEANRLFQQITAVMKPGKPVAQFYQEAISEIERSGARYMPDYGLGNGIGLSLKEFPVISDREMSRLAEGSCFALRIAIRDEKLGAIMAGKIVHVSGDGPEVLT